MPAAESAISLVIAAAVGMFATETLPPGYYPIRGSSITLTSGVLILWTE